MSTKIEIFTKLIDLISESKQTIKVCVPSTEFFRRAEDWTEEYIEVIDPSKLIDLLNEEISAEIDNGETD